MDTVDIEAHPTKLLECPICYNVFQSKIFMCSQGHNICDACRPKVEHCPVCRSEYTGARNHLVEQLLTRSIQYSCENKAFGCSEKLPLNKIQIHQPSCHYRPYKCFAPVCSWEGRHTEFKQHITSKHGTSVSTSREVLFSDRHFMNTEMEHNDYLFVNVSDELFVYFYKRDSSGKLLFEVLYIGPKENAENFRYMLSFKNEDRSKKMQLVSNVSTDVKCNFSESCLTLDYNTCKQFVRYNGILQYFLKIEKQGHKRNEIFEVMKERPCDE